MDGQAQWRGVVQLRPGRLSYRGRLASAHRHRHAAIQIVLAPDQPLRLVDASGAAASTHHAVIPAGVAHELSGATAGSLVFVEADSVAGQRLATELRRTGLPVDGVAAWCAAADRIRRSSADDLLAARESAEETAVSGVSSPALTRALAMLAGLLAEGGDAVRLEHLAAQLGLSASRLGHLFTEQLGVPFRPYVRWLRLQRAMEHARTGVTLTAAAHAAGFADSAHLTRVCHAMFGLAPSDLARNIAWE